MEGPQGSTFATTLLALNGKEKQVLLRISREGVQLLTASDNKEFNKFPFAVIKKWVPASQRSRNPGPPDCLDMQIHTDKGTRDLRMRCKDTNTVLYIIDLLRTTVMDVMRDMDKQPVAPSRGQLPPSGPTSGNSDTRMQLWSAQPSTGPPSTAEPLESELSAEPGQHHPHDHPAAAAGHSTHPKHATSQHSTADTGAAGSYGQPLSKPPLNPPSHAAQPWSDPAASKLAGGGVHAGGELQVSTRHDSISTAYMNAAYTKQPQGQPASHALTQNMQHSPSAGGEPLRQEQLGATPLLGLHPSPQKGSAALSAALAKQRKTETQLAACQAELTEALEQNRFLESMVKRLTHELADRQTRAEGEQETETELLVDDGAPLPVWLKDRRYLNPLLAAYDDKISGMEMSGAAQAEALATLQKQVEVIISENDNLRAELSRTLEHKALMAAVGEAGPGGQDGPAGLLRQQVELLRQENDLLVSQQSDLSEEIQRLQAQLQEQTSQAVSMVQANAAMLSRVQQQVHGAQVVEARHGKLHSSLVQAENRVALLSRQLADAQAQLEEERITADTATRTLEELQAHQASLKTESVSNAQAARAALDKQKVLQGEVTSLRERYECVVAELEAARKEVEELHATLTTLDAKLLEYQHKDAEAFSRICESMDCAEKACLSRDAALARQTDLQQEVELLQQRLAGVRQAVRDQVYAELQDTLHGLREELDATKELLKMTDEKAAEHKAAAERSRRDVSSLSSELQVIKEELGASITEKTKANVMTLNTMERIQELERERDELSQRLDTCSRQLERASRDWSLEKQAMEGELRSLRRSLADKESAATLAASEVTGLTRHVESLTSELNTLKEAHSRAENELRQQVTAARAERDMEVKAMATRLEAAMANCARSVSEAERVIGIKESLLAKWKEEANNVAMKMERALAEHKREQSSKDMALHEMRSQLQAMRTEHAAVLAELDQLRGLVPGLQASLQDAESRGSQLHMQLLAASTKEEEMMQEMRSLQAALERAQHQSRRAEKPGGDELGAKLMALRQAGAATLVGDGVVGVATAKGNMKAALQP